METKEPPSSHPYFLACVPLSQPRPMRFAPRIMSRIGIPSISSLLTGVLASISVVSLWSGEPGRLRPDIVVAQDGSGQFRSVQEAIDSVPSANTERTLIWIKNGTYNEHLQVERSFITLRGEDREKTRLLFEINDPRYDPQANADRKGIASFNIHNADDIVVENLTIENPAKLGGKPFAVFSSGRGTRIVIQDANILGLGGDTLSLWTRGLYYHRNLYVTGTYHFVGPRGTCYMSDSVLECLGKVTNALFNEGMESADQRFVLQRCRITSRVPFGLGSHFRDAAWYFVACEFSDTLREDGKIFVAQSNPQRPQPISAMFKWAPERVYFANSKGPSYAWLKDNIAQSPAREASSISAAWTFGGKWDPEGTKPPAITAARRVGDEVRIEFSEPVTVKGKPHLVFIDAAEGAYLSGSGSTVLIFRAAGSSLAARLESASGAIVASQASATLRFVASSLSLP